jgi:hypothetical protein
MKFTKPNNAVLVAGEPIVEELIAKTVANLTPGALVARDTDDEHVKAAGAADFPLGFADVSHKRGIGDTYAADEVVPVLSGPCVVAGILAESQTITKGDLLVSAGNGQLKKAAKMTVTVPSGTADAVAGTYDVAGNYPNDGIVVGRALESVSTGVGETKRIMLKCML